VSEPVRISRHGAIGSIELARPEKFNAMSRAAMVAVREGLDSFERADSGVRAILIHARGPHFCAGADLDESREWCRNSALLREFLEYVHETFRRIEASAIPVVGACQGMALAGGLELLLVCDVVFAAQDARFGDQHVQYGLVPAWGGSQRLPREIGLRRSLDLMYSGRRIDADTALQWGLVHYVVPTDQLLETAMGYCTTLAARSRPGTSAMKELARGGLDGSLVAGLGLELNRVVETMTGPDVEEGLAAFEARRPPVFKA
jgi:enoyl-CoA hydratase